MSSTVEGSWWKLFSVTGGVTVIHVDAAPHAANESAAVQWLDRQELSRLDRFRFPGAGRRFTLCRSALRAILSCVLHCGNSQISFPTGAHGKPFATVCGSPAPVDFSVSHSGSHGLIAISQNGHVGVDVEERAPRRHLEGLIETVMGPEERAELSALSGRRQLHRFLRIWTFKEALLKASGTGLYTDMSRVQVPQDIRRGGTRGSYRFPDSPSVTWGLSDLGNDDFAAALAWESTGNGRACWGGRNK